MGEERDVAEGRRASERAAAQFRAAVEAIDGAFGEGYARAHPELVASLVQSTAIGSAVDAGREASERLSATLLKMNREMGQTMLQMKPRLFG